MHRWKRFFPVAVILVGLFYVAAFTQQGLFGFTIGPRPNTCPTLQPPVDISKVDSVLYPGQYRGGDYKKHGGFRLDGQSDNTVTITAPIDAKLAKAGRYIEQGEIQYILYFKTDCGLTYRFDHLLTLTPKIQSVMEQQPEAKISQSNFYPVRSKVEVQAGETIATAVGFTQGEHGPNVSFDFGVYNQDQGLCWLDLLPPDDATKLRMLPGGDHESGKQSDYCK